MYVPSLNKLVIVITKDVDAWLTWEKSLHQLMSILVYYIAKLLLDLFNQSAKKNEKNVVPKFTG